jgi:uncharacterized DUF497 family protein
VGDRSGFGGFGGDGGEFADEGVVGQSAGTHFGVYATCVEKHRQVRVGDLPQFEKALVSRPALAAINCSAVIFEWDQQKAGVNSRKHRVAFEEASTVFSDPAAMTFADPDHHFEEFREITIGHTGQGKLLVVSHCERAGRIRIISARKATRAERKQYEESVDSKN